MKFGEYVDYGTGKSWSNLEG